MLKYVQKSIAKEEFYGPKKAINIWDVTDDNIVISNLTETKNDCKYSVGYLDEVIRSLFLMLPIVSQNVKTFKVEDGDNNKNNKLISFRIIYDKL